MDCRRYLGAIITASLLASGILCLAPQSAFSQPGALATTMVRNPTTGVMLEAGMGTIMVAPRPGTPAEEIRALCHRLNAKAGSPLFRGGLWVITLNTGQTVTETLDGFGGSPLVAFAEPDAVKKPFGEVTRIAPRADRPTVVPNDPLWSQLWGIQKIDCPGAWDLEKGDPSVVIAICDTGTDRDHSDLAAHTWVNAGETPGDGIDNDANGFIDDVYGWDFHDNDNGTDPSDVAGFPMAHGTHCSGTASGVVDNGIGVAGVAWNAQLMAVRVLSAAGGLSSRIQAGIQYAADMGADVINLSLGGGFTQSDQVGIDYAYGLGVTICAATGNSDVEFTNDPSTWFSPVCNDGVLGVDNKVLGVAASDENDRKASFSNYGGVYKFVDVSAPGVNILSTFWPGNGYMSWQGTSMACPHAAGLSALVVSRLGKNNPQEIIDQIRDAAVNIDGLNPAYAGKLGAGRLDASAAVGYDAPPKPCTAVNAFDTANDEGGSVTVIWKRSADDGGGHDDVVGYRVYRGTAPDPQSPTFIPIANESKVPKKSAGYIDADPNLVNGQSYYYYVLAVDAIQTSVPSNVGGPAIPHDDSSPPAVDNLVAQDTQADSGRSITLSWVGYQGSADLASFKVYRSTQEFTSVTETGVVLVETLSSPTARNYVDRATEPDADPTDPTKDTQPLDETDYWYAVTALDEVGNAIATVTPTGPVQCAPNLSLSYSYGLRMITVPATPIDPSPAAVLGFTDPTTIKLARYDPTTNAYHTVSQTPDDPFLRILPGRAFWMDRSTTTFVGVGGRAVSDIESEITLGQGWDQVGSPYDSDYPFEGITVRDQFGTDSPILESNLVRRYGWRYDAFTRGYRLVTRGMPGAQEVLPKREGMWVYAEQFGVKLVFGRDVVVPLEATAAAPPKLDGWQVQLIARTANAADTDNFLGVTTQADALGSIISPPPVSGGVDLFFTKGGGARMATDLRKAAGAQAKWQVVVECGAADTDVRLEWPDLGALPNDARPVLKDLATGRSIYMRTANGYAYRSREAGEQRKFEISFSEPALGPVITQVAATPAKGGVELSYWLERPAAVKVAVLNIAGRLVATVPVAQGQVGLNRVAWNGLASSGQGVPNGAYLIRVTAVADDNGETTTALRAVHLDR